MKEINIQDHHAIHEIIQVFQSDFPVAVLEFPKVFGLIAPHSTLGAQAIDRVKNRLPNKYYSSYIGDIHAFNRLIPIETQNLIDFMNHENHSVFLRFELENYTREPRPISFKGTHQVLLEDSNLRQFIIAIEKELEKSFSVSEFYKHNYQAPIISSLNISGSKQGAILDQEQALRFGKERGVPLFIHTGLMAEPLGSYPIFIINAEGSYHCERIGANYTEIEKSLKTYFLQKKS
jgi:hypothetical protein